jgi:hypothetical protein
MRGENQSPDGEAGEYAPGRLQRVLIESTIMRPLAHMHLLQESC